MDEDYEEKRRCFLFILVKKRTLIAILSGITALCLVLLIGAGVSDHEAVVTTGTEVNWGLNFHTQDGIPTGPASVEELKSLNACYRGDSDERTIYLTFDAGYENGFTPGILDVLKKHQAKACFFLVGNFLKTEPELVRRMIAEGHTVGNHTMTHPDMASIADEASFRRELSELEALYQETTGQEMAKLYRPPQGKYSKENLEMAQKMGYTTVFWSLAYADWNNDSQPTREEALDKLLPRTHNGAIVLLHSTSRTNSEILDELLTRWEEMGYRFGTLDELSSGGEVPQLST